MSNLFDQARLIIYRVNKKGLEVFLEEEVILEKNERIPSALLKYERNPESKLDLIELEDFEGSDGELKKVIAVEADWHEIPSVKKIIKQDIHIVKDKIKAKIPHIEEGKYVAVKEAFKKVLPQEYKLLKELKDIISDRNQAKYI